MSNLISYLFETHAVKICPDNKPFFLTSGKISPYFINTHFIYGSEQDANNLLAFIDSHISNKTELPAKILEMTFAQYNGNAIYKDVIDQMKTFITENIDLSSVDYISGGERRDWFFSNIMAFLLDKPHITLFKDLDSYVSDSKFEKTEKAPNLNGKRVLHIADLITVASSYVKMWIPAIQNLGATIAWTAVVVDRMQGGKEMLAESGIAAFSMVNIDSHLFDKALELGLLSTAQHAMLMEFCANPDGSMREFLLEHPEFLESALNGDEKTAARAKICVEENLYHL